MHRGKVKITYAVPDVAADYIKKYTNFSYKLFSEPYHVQVDTEWNERQVADITRIFFDLGILHDDGCIVFFQKAEIRFQISPFFGIGILIYQFCSKSCCHDNAGQCTERSRLSYHHGNPFGASAG